MSEISNSLDKLRGERVLITGGTGFIGSHLVEALKDICKVVILSQARRADGVMTINVDLRDKDAIYRNLAGLDIDIVFHVAGNVRMTGKDTAQDHLEVNAEGTKNLLEVCCKRKVKKFIYSSSMAVFDDSLYLPVAEKHAKVPNNFYGMSKLLAEIYCGEYARFHGMTTVILRYSTVYGPRQYDGEVIPVFISNALNGEALRVHGVGKATSDFVYVRDIVNANILAATKETVPGDDFNIGSGEETSIEDLAYAIKGVIPEASITYTPDKSPNTKRFVFDISKARDVLGYKPTYTLPQGLSEQIQHIRNTR